MNLKIFFGSHSAYSVGINAKYFTEPRKIRYLGWRTTDIGSNSVEN